MYDHTFFYVRNKEDWMLNDDWILDEIMLKLNRNIPRLWHVG